MSVLYSLCTHTLLLFLTYPIHPIFMDDLYTFSSSISSNYPPLQTAHHHDQDHHNVLYHQLVNIDQADHEDENNMCDVIKAQIANHPLYPTLLSAYIDCTKVGAPPEMASLLDEISKHNLQHISVTNSSAQNIGIDPQLDHFMKSYCEALEKYKEELSKPFDEATNFLTTIKSQLTTLCTQTLLQSPAPTYSSPDEDEDCGGASGQGGEEEVKEMLMRKYSGYLTTLRKEFLKKRKKGKLPKDAISALLDWWNSHYRWPYPTEEEKNRLSEMTGLDQKQINNWFINQRKRHWRPSEDMRFALMEGIHNNIDDPATYLFDPRIGT